MCFGTPACQIGDDRQIDAQSQNVFLNFEFTTPIFITFLRNVFALVPLLTRAFTER